MRNFRCSVTIFQHVGVCERGFPTTLQQVVLQTSASVCNSTPMQHYPTWDAIRSHRSMIWPHKTAPYTIYPPVTVPGHHRCFKQRQTSEVAKITPHSGCQIVTCSSELRKPIYSLNYWLIMKVSLQCYFYTEKWISSGHISALWVLFPFRSPRSLSRVNLTLHSRF